MDNFIKIIALGIIGYFGYKALAKKNIVPKIPAVGLGKGLMPRYIGKRPLPEMIVRRKL